MADFKSQIVDPKLWSSKKLLRDYQHAARTFRDGDYRLAPKQKFLFFVVFNFTPDASATLPDSIKREASMLVKSVDLPSYTFDTQLMNEYNRWRAIQTKINYNPVQIRLHDDMADISKTLWYSYLDWHYSDQKAGLPTAPVYWHRSTYTEYNQNFNFGMANPEDQPFFESIQLYSIYGKKQFSEYTLINPIITSFNHDSHDHSQSDVLENTMQIQYETVKYASGTMGGGQPNALEFGPKGFGDLHYDKDYSPNNNVNNSEWEKNVHSKVDAHKKRRYEQYMMEQDAGMYSGPETWKSELNQKDYKKSTDGKKTYTDNEVKTAKKSNQQHAFPGSTRPNPHTDNGVSPVAKKDKTKEVKDMRGNPHID
jgi:hypothetical protein